MRVIIMALATLMIGSAAETTSADPYRWCADYSGGDMGGNASCYFDSAPARKKTRRQN